MFRIKQKVKEDVTLGLRNQIILSDFKILEMALFRQTLRLASMTRSVPVALYHEKVRLGPEGENCKQTLYLICCRLLTTTRTPAMLARWTPSGSMWALG